MPERREREFAGDPRSPAAARSFARAALGELADPPVRPALCDDVELIVSELVTNAVRAGSPTVLVAIERDDDIVTVRVTDHADGWPEPREAGIHDPGGRGLPLVSAVSRSWGVRLRATGKVVWAEVPV